MKTGMLALMAVILAAGLALAADIDGKWVSERKLERNGQEFTITMTFDLKSDGSNLTGTFTMAFGEMEPRSSEIKDGKIEGNKFSFTTVFETPNGEMKTLYSGTLEGDSLKGTAAREGGQERPFEAKRKS